MSRFMNMMVRRSPARAARRRAALLAGLLSALLATCPATAQLFRAGPRRTEPQPARLPEVTRAQVAQAIAQAVAWIQARQHDGNWPGPGHYRGGHTALALLALLNAGVDRDSPAITQGLTSLLAVPNEYTYVVSLKCMVLAGADPRAYRAELNDAAQWLVRHQRDNGTWDYGPQTGGQDNSNTQFALMGLHEAAKAGVAIDPGVWQRSQKHFRDTQLSDGGWTYRMTSGQSYGSMTCAALASLFITGEHTLVGRERGYVGGAAHQCGQYSQNAAIARGLAWMDRNFSVSQNPQHGASWLHYYLYALERVGMTGGLRTIGRHDWYRLGAARLVNTQRPGGSWDDSLTDTAFALLFLSKGLRPVLIQKLQWSDNPGHWNPDRHDVAHAVEHVSGRLGKPLAWQSVPLSADVEDWLTAPILYMQGHDFPRLSPEARAKLRRYVDNGGLLVAEACCSRPAFARGFREFAAQAFGEFPLRELSLDHPLFHAVVELDRTHGIMGIDVGCRTGVLFLPNDVSCLWEQREVPGARELTRFAFDLAVNLCAYATGEGHLGDRLTRVELATRPAEPASRPAGDRGAVRVARLLHNGDAYADPHALAVLAELASRQAAIDIVSREAALDPGDPAIFDHPVLFMTGHFDFTLTDAQIANLAAHLSRGGVLLADACCGQEAFDTAFRRLASALAARIEGAADLAPLEADHPLLTARSGPPVGPVALRPALAKLLGRQSLEAPLILALTVRGRPAILYSPYDWTCGPQRDNPFACRGYAQEDAIRLGLALLLYAVSY